MNLSNASNQPFFLLLKRYWFECLMLLLLALYTSFYCTPSSYGIALNLLGIPNNGLILGTPKAIRSDEWSVWTPYLQALINNHFQRFNAYSIYHEDFRNFNALPINDWALLFKPQFWSFLMAEPARAFSFHHGFLIATFLIGWKQLIAKIIQPYPYATPNIAIGFSLLLFFSGFIQTIWTTMGPIIAFFPWLMLVLLAWQRHAIGYYCLLSYTMAVWLLSHTYPPLVVSMAYIGIMILGAFQTDFFSNIKRCLLSVLACLVGVGIVVYYYKDVIPIMMDTVYPGKRITVGGEGNVYTWLSTVIPYITHSVNGDTVVTDGLNICETTAVSSALPLLSLCFADIKKIKDLYRKEIIILISMAVFFSIWWLLPVPALIAKLLLLTNITAHRLVFALGLTINLTALIALLQCGTKLSLKRYLLFILLLIFCFFIPYIFEYFNYFKISAAFNKSTIELLLIPLIGTLWASGYYVHITPKLQVNFILISAMLINILYFGAFNPIQSAQPIFSAKNSDIVADLKKIEQRNNRGWLVAFGVRSAILNGLGLKAFTHTLIQPQLAFFRQLFPDVPDALFKQIFNRYANIYLHNVPEPDTPWPDMIRIPINKLIEKNSAVQFSTTNCNTHAGDAGEIDYLTLKDKTLYFDGWVMSSESRYLTNLKTSKLINYYALPRPDIAAANKDKNLLLSGFSLAIQFSDDDIRLIKQEGFCLYSESTKFGTKKLFRYSGNDMQAFLLNPTVKQSL